MVRTVATTVEHKGPGCGRLFWLKLTFACCELADIGLVHSWRGFAFGELAVLAH